MITVVLTNQETNEEFKLEDVTLDSISFSGIPTCKYGKFSWDPSHLKEVTSTSFTTNRNYDPFIITYTPSADGTPNKYTFKIDAVEDNFTANIAVARSTDGLSFSYGGTGTRDLSNKNVPSSSKS